MITKALIAQVQPTNQPQANPSPPAHFDPMSAIYLPVGIFIGGLITKYFPDILKAGSFEKRIEARIKEHQIETASEINREQSKINADISGRLTDNNVGKQRAEAEIDREGQAAGTLSEIAKGTVESMIGLLKDSVASATLYTEASISTHKATELLTGAINQLVDATNSLSLAQELSQKKVYTELTKVSQSQELAREDIAGSTTAITGKVQIVIDKHHELEITISQLREDILLAISQLTEIILIAIAALPQDNQKSSL